VHVVFRAALSPRLLKPLPFFVLLRGAEAPLFHVSAGGIVAHLRCFVRGGAMTLGAGGPPASQLHSSQRKSAAYRRARHAYKSEKITLYLQNIKLGGGNRTFLELYFLNDCSELGEIGVIWGLDKILGKRRFDVIGKERRPPRPVFQN
jgi:hypothetical protein